MFVSPIDLFKFTILTHLNPLNRRKLSLASPLLPKYSSSFPNHFSLTSILFSSAFIESSSKLLKYEGLQYWITWQIKLLLMMMPFHNYIKTVSMPIISCERWALAVCGEKEEGEKGKLKTTYANINTVNRILICLCLFSSTTIKNGSGVFW